MLLAFKLIKIFSTCMFPSRHQNRLAVFSLQKKVLLLSKISFVFRAVRVSVNKTVIKLGKRCSMGKISLILVQIPIRGWGICLLFKCMCQEMVTKRWLRSGCTLGKEPKTQQLTAIPFSWFQTGLTVCKHCDCLSGQNGADLWM